jgi:hypothetical protein
VHQTLSHAVPHHRPGVWALSCVPDRRLHFVQESLPRPATCAS